MQERSIGDINGKVKQFREFVGRKLDESPAEFEKRMFKKVENKLKDPQTISFSQIKIGRNQLCPCGSSKKFKKCCGNKINTGEFEVKSGNSSPTIV